MSPFLPYIRSRIQLHTEPNHKTLSTNRGDPAPGGTKYFCFIHYVDIEKVGVDPPMTHSNIDEDFMEALE